MTSMPDMRPLREDLQATLDARRDLGPEYEAALIDSFVERLDATIAARVRAEIAAEGAASRKPGKGQRNGAATMIPVAIGSLVLGVPLTSIASSNSGLVGLIVTWLAIAVINVAAALAVARRD